MWLALTFAAALPIMVLERAVVRTVFSRAVHEVNFSGASLSSARTPKRSASCGCCGRYATGYDVLGLLECDAPESVTSVPVLGNLARTRPRSWSGTVPAASSSPRARSTHRSRTASRESSSKWAAMSSSPSGLVDISADRLLARPLGRRAVMYVEPVRRFGWRAVAKRLFDIGIAATLLVLTTPLLVLSAIAIKINSRGPTIFSQVRIGKDGRLFKVHKLRTMEADAEERLDVLRERSDVDGPLFKIRDDPRVTTVGRFLRRTSIDELPQLWNVLSGEMSIVGPRPALPTESAGWTRPVTHAVAREAGHHGNVAGQRPEQLVLRRLRAARPLLRRQLVAAHRFGHRGQDGARGAVPAGAY